MDVLTKVNPDIKMLFQLVEELYSAWEADNKAHHDHETSMRLAEAVGRVNGQAFVLKTSLEIYGGAQ